MKNTSINAVSIFLFAIFSSAYASDGQITFSGTVTSSPCTVTTNSTNQNVALGQVNLASVTSATVGNAVTTAVPFSIALGDCSTTLSGGGNWSNASVLFTDDTVPSNTSNILTVVNSAPGSAEGVGVQILNNDKSPVTLGTESAPIPTTGTASQVLPFFAQIVKSSSNVTVGSVLAKSDFTVMYN